MAYLQGYCYVSFREGGSQWRNQLLWKVSEQEWSRTKCTGEIQIVSNSNRQTLYQTRIECRRLREDLSVHWEPLSLCAQFKHIGPGTHGMEWFWANSCIFQHVFLVYTHERRLKMCNGLWRLPWFFPGQQAWRRNRRENLEWVAAGWAASSGETQLLAAKRLPAPTRLCKGPWEALCTVEAYWDPQPEMKLST